MIDSSNLGPANESALTSLAYDFGAQTNRIKLREGRIPDIRKGRDPTPQPHRITLHIPPGPRLIVPEVVVVRPGFPVVLLAREAQVEGEAGEASGGLVVGGGVAEGSAVPAPGGLVGSIDHDTWRVEVVGVDDVDIDAAGGGASPGCGCAATGGAAIG